MRDKIIKLGKYESLRNYNGPAYHFSATVDGTLYRKHIRLADYSGRPLTKSEKAKAKKEIELFADKIAKLKEAHIVKSVVRKKKIKLDTGISFLCFKAHVHERTTLAGTIIAGGAFALYYDFTNIGHGTKNRSILHSYEVYEKVHSELIKDIAKIQGFKKPPAEWKMSKWTEEEYTRHKKKYIRKLNKLRRELANAF